MFKFFKFFYYNLIIIIILVPSRLLLAQAEVPGGGSGGGTVPGGSGNEFKIKIDNPLKDITTLQGFVETVLNNVVIPIGSVLVVMAIIYSGFKFVTARGNVTELEKAKTGFLWVVVGSAILLGSWLIATAIRGTVVELLK